MFEPPSVIRHRPIPSKFSSAKPSGSICLWQPAQAGFARCCSILSRIVKTFPAEPLSVSAGTFGGGGGGGAPSTLSRIHFPRRVGAVLLGYEVTVRILP